MKRTILPFKLPVLILFLTFAAQVAQSQRYYTPPGRSEALIIGSPDIGRDFYNPIDLGLIMGNIVYTDARDLEEYYNFYHYKAHGVCYRFSLSHRSTVIIDQLGSWQTNNMSINLIDRSTRNELPNDWNLVVSSLPSEYLSHPFVVASGEEWFNVLYKMELGPGEYYIASNGGYGNAGWYAGIVVTNIHIYSHQTNGGSLIEPYEIGTFDRSFEFTDRKEVSGQQSIHGNDTPDVVYAFETRKKMTISVNTKGSDSPGSYVYILNEDQLPVPRQNVIVSPQGFVTATVNNLIPGIYFVVSEAGEHSGELQTTIKGYMAPEPSDENGPMPEPDPYRQILPEPVNDNPIRYRYDPTGNRTDRRIYWPTPGR